MKCGLRWMPHEGEPRYERCSREATQSVRAPGEEKSQLICDYHAGQLAGLLIRANTIAEDQVEGWRR